MLVNDIAAVDFDPVAVGLDVAVAGGENAEFEAHTSVGRDSSSADVSAQRERREFRVDFVESKQRDDPFLVVAVLRSRFRSAFQFAISAFYQARRE